MKHDELMMRLADHLASLQDRMMWTDMQLGPSGSPRPDVYTIRKSYSDPRPMAYEVKVSVSDFRSDITKGKWQSYLQFASSVTFVVPKGLVAKTDIPNGCGLITYSEDSDSFYTVKAPTLQKVALPERAMLKLLIDGVERQHKTDRAKCFNQFTQEKSLRKKFGDRVAAAVFDVERAESSALHKVANAERQLEHLQTRYESEKERFEDTRRGAEREANRALAEVGETLGLDPEVSYSAFQIQNRIRQTLLALDKDEVISSLNNKLRRIRDAIAAETPTEKLDREIPRLRSLS